MFCACLFILVKQNESIVMIRYFGAPYRNATVSQNIMRHFIFQELHELKRKISHPGVLHDLTMKHNAWW